jgi:hypothetical protein
MPLAKRWKPGNWIARAEEVRFRSKRWKKQRRAELFRQKKKLARQRLSLVLAPVMSGQDVDHRYPAVLA